MFRIDKTLWPPLPKMMSSLCIWPKQTPGMKFEAVKLEPLQIMLSLVKARQLRHLSVTVRSMSKSLSTCPFLLQLIGWLRELAVLLLSNISQTLKYAMLSTLFSSSEVSGQSTLALLCSQNSAHISRTAIYLSIYISKSSRHCSQNNAYLIHTHTSACRIF